MNIREADKALGEVFHIVERNTVMTKDLDEAFSMIHYALEKIEADKHRCETCALKTDCPEESKNVPLSKKVLGGIVNYLSLDLKCKFSPSEFCDSHVDCVDCDIAKAQSITFQMIEKEFAKWSKSGI